MSGNMSLCVSGNKMEKRRCHTLIIPRQTEDLNIRKFRIHLQRFYLQISVCTQDNNITGEECGLQGEELNRLRGGNGLWASFIKYKAFLHYRN
jgi:hypothetical protein